MADDIYHQWKSLNINKNQIEHETAKAVLVRCPNNSEYKGYTFWWPKKLIHEGANSAALRLSYNPMMSEFKVFKTTPKTFQRVAEDVLGAEDIEQIFEVTSSNISAPEFKPTVEVKEAPKLDMPTNIEIPEDLKNEDNTN